ncbi:hypothetical protein STEG23_011966, partial [Scotinomys teguina]
RVISYIQKRKTKRMMKMQSPPEAEQSSPEVEQSSPEVEQSSPEVEQSPLEVEQSQLSQNSNHTPAGDAEVPEALSISRQNGCCD